MATNNRPLKAFIRYDGSGRAVSSSLIWRKNKPKVGKWKEVQGYECCNPDVNPLSDIIICTTVDSETYSQSVIGVIIESLGGTFIFQGFVGNNTSTTYQELVEFLNTNFSFLGQFTYSAPDEICLQLSSVGPVGYGVSLHPSPSSWLINIVVP
jgi:hypothetical protein